MIRNAEIEATLSRLLREAIDTDVAIVYVNGPNSEVKPRLKLEHTIVSRMNPGLRPGSKVQKGIWHVKIITDKTVGNNNASNLSDDVMEVYPFGHAVELTDHVLRVYKEPEPQDAMELDASWCLPVSFHYIVTDK